MTGNQFNAIDVGVVGAGQWARIAHLAALSQLPGVNVVAVADIDQATARAVAAEFGVRRTYWTGAELISGERLDLVVIATPDDSHVADAVAALAAGVPVLCEKPLATTVNDARELAMRAAETSSKTKMGFSLRYAPAIARMRQLVQDGFAGEPRHVQAFQQNGQFLDPGKHFHWKMDSARTGGGAIVEYGVHTIDLLRWIVGDVARVVALSGTAVTSRPVAGGGMRPVTVDDSTAVLLDFANGISGMLHAGWSTVGRPPGIELRVYGSRGALRCVLSDDLPGSESLQFADGESQRFEPVEIPNAPLIELPWWQRYTQLLLEDFLAEIRGITPPSATFADGYAAQVILDAVIASASEQRWVDVGDQWLDRPVTQS